MHHQEILRQLCGALGLTHEQVVSLFAGVGHGLTPAEVPALFEAEGDDLLELFLDGLILERRGPRDPGARPVATPPRLTNNLILKKLRIALELREPELLALLDAGGHPLSNRELTTLFRNPDHKHFRRCGDDVVHALLEGLALREAGGTE